MSLRAVIFDYGMVLTGQPSAEAHDAMLRITGLPHDQFEAVYWADRHAYDEGKLTGLQFWQNLVRDAKLNLDAAAIDELNLWDARMWTTQNPAMLAWQQQLKQQRHPHRHPLQHGRHRTRQHRARIRLAPALRRPCLELPAQDGQAGPRHLSTHPRPTRHAAGETLFIDDKQVNIDAARALGLVAIQFSTIEKLREDLISTGLDKDLPLPELTAI